jgi:DNA-binding beta-propeller fold protein YncE
MSSGVILGSGDFKYEDVLRWETLPEEYRWREVPAVAVDEQDNVYAFNRGDHPVVVFDKNGNFKKTWGEGMFPRAHGISVAPDGNLFLADDGDHTIRKCTPDGKVLFMLGASGKPAPKWSGDPFNRCTHVAFDPHTAEFYVSDGYGNGRVHKYTPDGKLLFSWGGVGNGYGEFNICHNIATDRDGYVFVADRENHRIQVFDKNGRFEAVFANVHRPSALYISKDQHVYVGEIGSGMSVNADMPNIGPRVSILNTRGDVLARVGNLGYGLEPGQMVSPHGISVDSQQNIFMGEVSFTNRTNAKEPIPADMRSFRKLAKVS